MWFSLVLKKWKYTHTEYLIVHIESKKFHINELFSRGFIFKSVNFIFYIEMAWVTKRIYEMRYDCVAFDTIIYEIPIHRNSRINGLTLKILS